MGAQSCRRHRKGRGLSQPRGSGLTPTTLPQSPHPRCQAARGQAGLVSDPAAPKGCGAGVPSPRPASCRPEAVLRTAQLLAHLSVAFLCVR